MQHNHPGTGTTSPVPGHLSKNFMTTPPKLKTRPSSASTWMKCTAQPGYLVRNHDRLPVSTDTAWNIEGDQAHAVAEAVLLKRPVPKESNGKAIPTAKLPEMLRHARGFMNFCLEDDPVEWHAERKVGLFYAPGFGKIDFSGVKEGLVSIVDLKYGKGVAVNAEENYQLAIYARSFIEQNLANDWFWSVNASTQVKMAIYQPRVRDGEPVTEWVLPWSELHEFTEDVRRTAQRIHSGDPGVFAPGDKTCQFCEARPFCEARNGDHSKALAKVAPIVRDEIHLPDPGSLTRDQLAVMLRYRPALKKWLDDIYKMAAHDVARGVIPKGFKLVKGRGSSVWDDQDTAEAVLDLVLGGDDIHESKLITPNKATVLMKERGVSKTLAKQVSTLVRKIPGKATLVHESDPRPAIGRNAAELMDCIEDDPDDMDE